MALAPRTSRSILTTMRTPQSPQIQIRPDPDTRAALDRLCAAQPGRAKHAVYREVLAKGALATAMAQNSALVRGLHDGCDAEARGGEWFNVSPDGKAWRDRCDKCGAWVEVPSPLGVKT